MSAADREKETPGQMEVNEVESASSSEMTWTAEEEKKLVRKIDLFLLPTIWLMYLLSYMVSSLGYSGRQQLILNLRTERTSATLRLPVWLRTSISVATSTALHWWYSSLHTSSSRHPATW
jgi:hypothetical protein